MRRKFVQESIAALSILAAPPAVHAQSAVDRGRIIDEVQYAELLRCTVTRNALAAREAAEFRLMRLPHLTSAQAEADPSSSAWIKALAGCYDLQVGQPLSFNYSKLVADWASYFKISAVEPDDADAVRRAARCVANTNRGAAKTYLKSAPPSPLAHLALLVQTHCGAPETFAFSPRANFDLALRGALRER